MATYYVDSAITDTYPASATPDFTTYNHVTFETTGGTDSVYKTIADVNAKMSTLASGDSVLFRRGQSWQESLVINKTGLTSYLTFGAYGTGAKPIIWQATGAATAITCTTANVAYIHIDNIEAYTVKGAGTNSAIYFSADNLSYIWLSNILVSQSAQNGIFLQKINTYVIENSTVHDCDNCNVLVYGSATYKITNGRISNVVSYNAGVEDGLMIHVNDSDNEPPGAHHLVENCEVYNNYEDGFDLQAGDDITVRGCYSHGNNGRAYSLGAHASNIIVEDSWAVSNSSTGGAYAMSAGVTNATVRYCIAYHTGTSAALFTGNGSGNISNAQWYNNTIVITNNAAKLFGVAATTLTTFIVKNNIFVHLGTAPPSSWVYFFSTTQNPTEMGCDWNYNWYYVPNVTEGTNARWYVTKNTTSYSYATWKSTWSQDANSSANRTVNPLLVNGSGNWSLDTDFKLQSGSPCRDVGVNLGLTKDYFGGFVPIGSAPDIGVHEYPSDVPAKNALFYCVP
jgi:hypothetical protein